MRQWPMIAALDQLLLPLLSWVGVELNASRPNQHPHRLKSLKLTRKLIDLLSPPKNASSAEPPPTPSPANLPRLCAHIHLLPVGHACYVSLRLVLQIVV